MPRQSRESLTTFRPRIDAAATRLQPSVDLSQDERALFTRIVNACPSDHFRPTDAPLLDEYVRECCLARTAAEEIRRDGAVIDGKASAWYGIRQKSIKLMCILSVRLRLNPQARLHQRSVARQVQRPVSYYDQMEDDAHDQR